MNPSADPASAPEKKEEHDDNKIAQNYQSLQTRQALNNMSMGSQFYLRQTHSRPKAQMTLAERKQRAQNLIMNILQLKKPMAFGKLSNLADSKRVLQTLVNTEHIAHRNESINKQIQERSGQ